MPNTVTALEWSMNSDNNCEQIQYILCVCGRVLVLVRITNFIFRYVLKFILYNNIMIFYFFFLKTNVSIIAKMEDYR